jgi:dTMP kinase
MRGRFITFEGIDGAGKSTHLDWFGDQLKARGIAVVCTREPGGSDLAEELRELLLQRPMSLETELLLVFAARRDHLERTIRPALVRGEWVLCDRFTDSTYAYQGGGRGAPSEQIATLESWVHPGLKPDRTYLFHVDPAIAAARRTQARAADRFESEDDAFFGRVADAYARRVASDPERFVVIDGTMSVIAIRALLEKDLVGYC